MSAMNKTANTGIVIAYAGPTDNDAMTVHGDCHDREVKISDSTMMSGLHALTQANMPGGCFPATDVTPLAETFTGSMKPSLLSNNEFISSQPAGQSSSYSKVVEHEHVPATELDIPSHDTKNEVHENDDAVSETESLLEDLTEDVRAHQYSSSTASENQDTSASSDSEETEVLPRVRTSYGMASLSIGIAKRPAPQSSFQDPEAPGVVLFENDYFQIRKSDMGGWGAFAIKDLPCRTHILIERPLIHCEDWDFIPFFRKLAVEDQELVLDLHAYEPTDDSKEARARSVNNTNSFICRRESSGLFLVASRFNHACSPRSTVKYTFDVVEEVLTFTIGEDPVSMGEELTISYGKRWDWLLHKYGFECRCGPECEEAREQHLHRGEDGEGMKTLEHSFDDF